MTENIASEPDRSMQETFLFSASRSSCGALGSERLEQGRRNLGGTFHRENIKHSTSCSRAVILKRRFLYSSDTIVVAISRASCYRLVSLTS
jgi:hypothetical protein